MTEQIVNNVLNLFADIKMVSCCLLSSIVLYEKLKQLHINSKIVEGYLLCVNNYYTRHYWVRCDEGEVDISTLIFNELTKSNIKVELLETEPVIYVDKTFNIIIFERLDMNTEEKINELKMTENGYKLYIEKGFKEFINHMPHGNARDNIIKFLEHSCSTKKQKKKKKYKQKKNNKLINISKAASGF